MKKPPAHEKQQEAERQDAFENTRDKELSEAFERVYRRYGSDLSAFHRDVQREQREHLIKRG